MIVHRLVSGDAEHGFRTQGDNLEKQDPWTPAAGDMVGKVWWHLPNGGHLLLWLLQPAVLGGLMGGMAVYAALGWGRRVSPPGPARA
jgi:hypothetical protein